MKGKTAFIERQIDKKTDAADLKNKLIDDVKKSHGQMQTNAENHLISNFEFEFIPILIKFDQTILH